MGLIAKANNADTLVSNVTRFLATMPVGRDTKRKVIVAMERRMKTLRMRALAKGVPSALPRR